MAPGRERPAAGMVIDGDRLEEKIHEGSMATIWRVRDGAATEPMVMKIPLLRDFDDPTAMVGFEVERMILRTLAGVHVPRFIAADDFSQLPYIVMEYVPGDSLRARIDDAPLQYEELAAIGARAATAPHDLHGRHLIHLDRKPMLSRPAAGRVQGRAGVRSPCPRPIPGPARTRKCGNGDRADATAG